MMRSGAMNDWVSALIGRAVTSKAISCGLPGVMA
jgi:hypothetical protein